MTDTHTHTLVSTHAFSTICENARYAADTGIELIAATEHGPHIIDAPHPYYFQALPGGTLPRTICGVRILRGVEANLCDFSGTLDIPDDVLARLDWVIVSMHGYVLPSGTVREHTDAWLRIAQNPLVDCIGHSGQDDFRYDYEEGVRAFKKYGKIVEINNHSPAIRAGARKNCQEIAALCKEYEAPITLGSDAHICFAIGHFDTAYEILRSVDFPPELIVNRTADTLCRWISAKKGTDFNV